MNKKILTIPNIISFIRLAFIPIYSFIFLHKNYLFTFILLVALAVSDYIDGFLARKLKQESKIGEILDPIGDRALILLSYFCGMITNIIPWYFFILIIIRDILVGIKMLISKKVNNVNFAGKFGSFALMICAPVFIFSAVISNSSFYLFQISSYYIIQGFAYAIGFWGIFMYYIAGFEYIFYHRN